jgi:phage terminase small subunit
MPTNRLRPKQQRFVNEYLVDLNGTRAAIRAGYSARTAASIANENLRKPEIAAAIDAARTDMQVRTEVTADRVIKELAKIAFLDVRKLFSADGSLKAVHELDDDTAAAVVNLDVRLTESESGEITMTARIKLADKRAALVDLGRHLGIFDAKREQEAENPLARLIREVQGTSLPIVANPPGDEDEVEDDAAA